MRFQDTGLEGLYLIALDQKRDERGYFARTFCEDTFAQWGIASNFPQCGTAFNAIAGTVRGMHFQTAPHGEAKLVRCTRGAIHDAVVDLRPDSATYLKCYQVQLTESDGLELYVPAGFAHGYQTLTDSSEVHYMMSTNYVAAAAAGIRWDDPAISLSWPRPITGISERDRSWPLIEKP
jgi:dTDP-4-dehydrorhamnose 3,5-epimerase